jgi:hypothetical protein
MKYRIRGATGGVPDISKRSPLLLSSSTAATAASTSTSTSTWMTDEEKEGVLEARLKEANRQMAKQKKLQQWLAEKAKKEQELLDEHMDLENAKKKAYQDAEKRRVERNKENKAKLTSWRQQQIDELNSLLGEGSGEYDDGERPPPDW